MISEIKADIKKLDVSGSTLKKFTYVVSGALAIIGVILVLKSKVSAFVFFGFAGALNLIESQSPRLTRVLYKLWMGVAICIGWVMSRVLLFIVFYVVITPWGFVLRLLGKDILDRNIQKEAISYWVEKQKQPEDIRAGYRKMF